MKVVREGTDRNDVPVDDVIIPISELPPDTANPRTTPSPEHGDNLAVPCQQGHGSIDGDFPLLSQAELLDDFRGSEHNGNVNVMEDVECLLAMDDDDDDDCMSVDVEEVEESIPYPSQPLTSTNMRSLHRRLRSVVRWDRLMAILCLDGRSSFPEKLYKIMAEGIFTSSSQQRIALPDPRTVRNTLRPQLLSNCYAHSRILRLQENSRRDLFTTSYHVTRTDNVGQSDPLDCVRLVLPSEWAKLDVCTAPFYNAVYAERPPNELRGVDVELSGMVTHRSKTLLREPTLRARFMGSRAGGFACIDDTLQFTTTSDPGLQARGIYGWFCTRASDGGTRTGSCHVTGDVGPTLVVGSPSAAAQDTCNPRFSTDMPESYKRAEETVLRICSSPTRKLDVTLKDLTAPGSRRSRNFPSSNRDGLRQATLGGRNVTCDLDLFPGDTITAIRPRGEAITESVVCLLHSSPVSALARETAEMLVWVALDAIEDGRGGDGSTSGNVIALVTRTVIGVPVFQFSDAKVADMCESKLTSSNLGHLPNGERYVVYRASLYADGFQANKTTRTSKSVGGIYLLPQGRPVEDRSSAKAVRPLCLVPHGMPYGPALHMILDDLVTAAQTGVTGVDSCGRNVRIYIDTLSFLGDFPQATAYTDVLGHTATAMCNICTIRRRKGHALPETNFTSELHAGRLGYARFNERRAAIRAHAPHDQILRGLGMEYQPSVNTDELPAVRFADLYKPKNDTGGGSASHTQRRDEHPSPLNLCFDHARSVPVLPDHMLASTVSNVMAACFHKLGTNDERSKAEMRLVHAAVSNGLQVKRHVLSWNHGKSDITYGGIASNAMSAWFSILSVGAAVFQDIFEVTSDTLYLLPDLLLRLVTLVYKWPNAKVEGRDGEQWTDFSVRQHQLHYQHEVAQAGMRFLHAARQEFKMDKTCGAFLDKPNTHRLLELVQTTIPMYGHGRLCSELVLEHTHTLFKSWLQNNSHTNAHLTAMEKALSRDWMWRLSSLYSIWLGGDSRTKEQAEVGLRRVLVGEAGWRVDSKSRGGERFGQDMCDALKEAMRAPVPALLLDCDEMNTGLGGQTEYAWSVFKEDKQRKFDVYCFDAVDKVVSCYASVDVTTSDFVFYERARFMARATATGQRSYRHNCVEVGEAVSAVIDRNADEDQGESSLQAVTDGSGYCRYFAVAGIIANVRTDEVWVVVKELRKIGESYSAAQSCVRLLLLNNACRRVAVVHKCTNACHAHGPRKPPRHTHQVLEGGEFHVVSRRDGFPPFLG